MGNNGCYIASFPSRGSITLQLTVTFLLLCPVFSLSGSPLVLNEVLRTAGFSDDEIQQVRQGKILKAIRKSPNEREIVLSFACLFEKMSPEKVTEMILTSERYDEMDLTTTDYGILQEGCLEELERLKLEPNGKKWSSKYMNAKAGTEINLSEEEISAFNDLKKSSDGKSNPIEAVEKQIRECLIKRYEAYRESGLKGIFPYARAKGKKLDPSEELLSHKTKITGMIEKQSPAFYRYLKDYPNNCPEGLKESFSWYNLNADGTPTFVLSHRMGMLDEDVHVLSERIYYNSCLLNCVQSTGGAFPVEEGGTALVFSMRADTDMITGFGGSAKRALGTKLMGTTMVEQLERMQNMQ